MVREGGNSLKEELHKIYALCTLEQIGILGGMVVCKTKADDVYKTFLTNFKVFRKIIERIILSGRGYFRRNTHLMSLPMVVKELVYQGLSECKAAAFSGI